jgi:NTP pyrophosphatase (non-canonical NTP hydrolase)
MTETQATVSDWADSEFGPAPSNMRIGTRANEEMAELLRALAIDDNHPKAAEEIADVVIILYRLARNLGTDLQTEIDRKMAINRTRIWKRDYTGHGYHVRDRETNQGKARP